MRSRSSRLDTYIRTCSPRLMSDAELNAETESAWRRYRQAEQSRATSADSLGSIYSSLVRELRNRQRGA